MEIIIKPTIDTYASGNECDIDIGCVDVDICAPDW